MKKLLLLLSAVGMIFTACEGGEGVEEENGGTPFVPEITISPKDLTFGCNGGEQVVDITANFEYEVTERASWIAVEQTDEGLLVVVEANKNTSERSAFISITNSQYDINKTVEVWQEGYVPKIELAQQSIEVEFEPAEYEVAVTSPYSWEATSKNDWIIVDTPNGIAGTKMLKFSVVRNEEEDIREGTTRNTR
ncbi:MAG: BACON domain-containing protein [Alistipes sp.]|nr:BACON domain-containing protein [Alistipes sp.]